MGLSATLGRWLGMVAITYHIPVLGRAHPKREKKNKLSSTQVLTRLNYYVRLSHNINITIGVRMTKAMTKYQLDHFRNKVKRQFNPLIQDQELLVKQFTTEATDKAVHKLSKKIGADTIIKKFKEAEAMLNEARATALTFFGKKET